LLEEEEKEDKLDRRYCGQRRLRKKEKQVLLPVLQAEERSRGELVRV